MYGHPGPYISSFLVAHREVIANASLTSGELTIAFKPDVSAQDVLIAFADLITFAHPVKATIFAQHNVRLEFE